MRRIEKTYIELEIGMATWNVDINNNAMEDILDEGIRCYPEDIYSIIYEGYNISEDKLKMMLNEPDNPSNMLYPLDCYKDLSYNDWLEYKKEKDTENEIQEYFENHGTYHHRSNNKYQIKYLGHTFTADCPRKVKEWLSSKWK